MKKQLLIGCGHSRVKQMWVSHETDWEDVTTLDINPDCNPDIIHDLETESLPFEDNSLDEIHAYGVLEHLSDQGDHVSFFKQFNEFYRVLKPGGHLLASVPSEEILTDKGYRVNPQLWGDPSHRRVINDTTLAFLSQKAYDQCGKTMMTDFRNLYKGDFVMVWHSYENNLFNFVLEPIKEVPGWISENTPKE